MTWVEAAVLGIVQGLTEFLPVSSSGHLVVVQHLLGIQEPQLAFDTLVHFGTLVAVVAAFWTDLWAIFTTRRRLIWMLALATVPAAAAGLLLEGRIEALFGSVRAVGVGLWITGALLLAVSRRGLRGTGVAEVGWDQALAIGVGQALALVPGISRSGTTIAAGLSAGLEREAAARFSFLLSIPAILGAGVLQLPALRAQSAGDGTTAAALAVGAVAAAASGYVAIRFLLGVVRRGRLAAFAFYTWAVGLLVLVGLV